MISLPVPTGIRKRRTLASRPPRFKFLPPPSTYLPKRSKMEKRCNNIPNHFFLPLFSSFLFFSFTGIQEGARRGPTKRNGGEKKSTTEGGEALHHGELKMMIGGKRAASRDGGAEERWSAAERRTTERRRDKERERERAMGC